MASPSGSHLLSLIALGSLGAVMAGHIYYLEANETDGNTTGNTTTNMATMTTTTFTATTMSTMTTSTTSTYSTATGTTTTTMSTMTTTTYTAAMAPPSLSSSTTSTTSPTTTLELDPNKATVLSGVLTADASDPSAFTTNPAVKAALEEAIAAIVGVSTDLVKATPEIARRLSAGSSAPMRRLAAVKVLYTITLPPGSNQNAAAIRKAIEAYDATTFTENF